MLLKRVTGYARQNGMRYTIHRAMEVLRERTFKEYDRLWRKMEPTAEELQAQRQDAVVREAGLISVVIPVYNTRPDLLLALANSLLAQSYENWEACLYDGCSTNPLTVKALEEAAKKDGRFHIARGERNEGIAGNSNRAVEMAKGAWIALCDHDDLLTADALYCVAKTICEEQPDLIYSDEDKVNEEGTVFDAPHFKPDFCPDNLRSGNYICHLTALRRSLLDKVGGFRPVFDGSQDHDLMLRCVEATDRIVHIPRVLYHWRTVGASMSHQQLERCLNAASRAVEEHMTRIGYPGKAEQQKGVLRLTYEVKPPRQVEVIVIDSGDPKTWPGFVDALKGWHDYPVHRTVISPWRQSARDIDGDWIEWKNGGSVFPCLNRAASQSQADVLVILHSSVMMEGDGQWLTEMLMYAQRDDVGAVTPMLVHRRSILHAGFAVGMEDLVAGRGLDVSRYTGGWRSMLRTSHNVAAVSAACLMIRKDHFLPFDEGYTGGLGAVDWCLRLGQMGYHHVYTPHAVGKTADSICMKWLLLTHGTNAADAARYVAKFGENVHDSCYGEEYSHKRGNFSLPRDK